jgi:hypothetical protein
LTPFGPEWIDRLLSSICGLRGDFIPDFRLLDYPVALMSTEKSPALDGTVDNLERLRKDLDDLGVFDRRMSPYLLYRLREFHRMGFSGFEGRYYSLFPSFARDMAQAVNLQQLLTCLAFKYIVAGKYCHEDIPDSPFVESERRQIFFGAAAGVPTFFVRRDTTNVLMRVILAETRRTRTSKRYSRYIRVHNLEYRRALVRILRRDAGDLVEMLGCRECLNDLETRLEPSPGSSAVDRLTKGILAEAGLRSPFARNAGYINRAAERYYRATLKREHLGEAIEFLEQDIKDLESDGNMDPQVRETLNRICFGRSALSWLHSVAAAIVAGSATLRENQQLIRLMLVLEHVEAQRENGAENSSVY